jgi:hypothetical protein
MPYRLAAPVPVRMLVGALAFVILPAALIAAPGAPWAAAKGGKHERPLAKAARSVNLVETAYLKLRSSGESTLNESGNAKGTFNAPLVARMNLSANRVTATFTIYPKGGSITGKASARFVVRNSTGYYGGTLDIVHGTGSYRHASGSGIDISGTINRLSFALTVKAHGRITI